MATTMMEINYVQDVAIEHGVMVRLQLNMIMSKTNILPAFPVPGWAVCSQIGGVQRVREREMLHAKAAGPGQTN